MSSTGKGFEELTIRGAKFVFRTSNSWRVIARVDDAYIDDFGPMPVTAAMQVIDSFVDRYVTSEVSITRISRITTEHGFVLIFELQRGAETALVSFELV
jgi:hypothetical protein